MSSIKHKSSEEILYDQQSVIRVGTPGYCGYIQIDAVGLITKATPSFESRIGTNIATYMEIMIDRGVPLDWMKGKELDG